MGTSLDHLGMDLKHDILLVQTSHRHDSNNVMCREYPAVEICCAITSDHRQQLPMLDTFGIAGMELTWCPLHLVSSTATLTLTNLEEHTVSLKDHFQHFPKTHELRCCKWAGIANEVNDHPKNISRIARISSTT